MNVKFSDRISAISAGGDDLLPSPKQAAEKRPEIAWRIRRLQGMAKNLGYIMPLDKAIDLNEFDRAVAGKDVGPALLGRSKHSILGCVNRRPTPSARLTPLPVPYPFGRRILARALFFSVGRLLASLFKESAQ